MKVLSFLAAVLLSFPNLYASPQASAPASSSSSQAITLLAQSAAALTGRTTVSDVTLSGTARRIAGSDDESGTAILRAMASDASRMDLILPSGPRSEIRNASGAIPLGAWSGPDNVSHPIAYHSLLTDATWFFPSFGIARALAGSPYVATYIGQETRNSTSVQHLAVWQLSSSTSTPAVALVQRLSQVDLYLNSTTFLPVAICFRTHPDNNVLIDIPIEVQFSDYRLANGVQIPFHLQQFVNNNLAFDFQFQVVALNTGMTASTFAVQAQ